MSNSLTGLKALITYLLIIPVALVLGYVLANPLQYSTFATVGIVLGVMLFPLLMKWHHPLLLLTWNMGGTIIFIKGQPEIWMLMVAISLGISILHRTLVREATFVWVPQIVMPLLFIAAVAVITAKLTAGFGLRSFGGEVFGGKKYIYLAGAVMAYFAITAQRISPERAATCIGLFYLGGLARAIGDMYLIAPSWMEPIFWIFSPTRAVEGQWDQVVRLGGVTSAGVALFSFLLAKYGIRGLFISGTLWRIILFVLSLAMTVSGGFRSALITVGLLFTIQFFLEGMHRTKLLPVFVSFSIAAFVLLIPFVEHLPFGVQRTLAILPLPVDPVARLDAQYSTNWRLELWAAVLPEVPDHLLLGKGYALSPRDYAMSGATGFHTIDAAQQDLALSGDYHSGPLSVILPLGVWGVIGFLWFLVASGRVLHSNYKYGDPALHGINTFLWAIFLTYVLRFFLIYGALHSDMVAFAGIIGLSVCLNGGISRPIAKTALLEPTSLQKTRRLSSATQPAFGRVAP